MNSNPNPDQKILMLRGIPGTGKTDAAFAWVAENKGWHMRVSRSDISEQLYGRFYDTLTDEHELATVSHMQHSMVNGALKAHLSVVIDDPNLDAQTIREWMSLADRYKVKFENRDFEADFTTALRNTQMPEEAFRKHYNFTVKGKLAPMPEKPEVQHLDATTFTYVPDESLPPAYICDLDGTVFKMVGRSPFAYHRVDEDELIENVARVVKILAGHAEIVFMTGREDVCRELSKVTLESHGFVVNYMYMRPEGDKDTPDQQLKLDLFNEHVRHNFNVLGVFDDRRKVCKMWEEIGLTLFRVGPMDSDF